MKLRIRMTRGLLLPVLLLALFSHHAHSEGSMWDTLLGAVALMLLIGAMGGRIWANVHLAGRKDRTLVTGGPYRFVRNPLYLFSLIGFVGAGLAFGSIVLGAISAAVFFAFHWPEIRAEEERLQELFGAEYERYRQRVPRMIPVPSKVLTPSTTSRELVVDQGRFGESLRDCLAIPMVLVIAEVLEWAKLEEIVPVLIHLP